MAKAPSIIYIWVTKTALACLSKMFMTHFYCNKKLDLNTVARTLFQTIHLFKRRMRAIYGTGSYI